MSMKPQAGGNRKPGGSNSGAAAASGTGGAGGGVGRQNVGRGRNNAKGPSTAVALSGVYANMRMVHVLTSVVGTKCELKVKNGLIYEGVFKTYGPECDIVLDAAHRKSVEPNVSPRREDIVESIIFKSSDVVVVHFKDVDLNYAKKVSSDADNFTDSAVSARLNGEHKEKDLEPWDGGEQHILGSMESLDTDLSNGWDPDEMFKYNEETYGVKSTYDSSLSSYTVPLERDNSEEFLKREARASQLAEEIEASATYKARVALENDDRSEEEKYTAVVRGERELHSLNRENKYIPPSQRNREPGMSWGAGRQNSPRMVQCSPGPPPPRSGPHDYNAMDQRVVNGGAHPWPSRCPSPSSRPPSRYQSGPTNSLPPRVATPTRPPSRPPSRPSRPLSHPSAHGSTGPLSIMPKRLSSEGPPRMSPKSQRTPRPHRVASCRGGDYMSQGASVDVSAPPPTRNSPSGGTWSSVVSGAHRPRSPRQNSIGGGAPSPSCLSSPQAGTVPVDSVTASTAATSPTAANPATNLEASTIEEAKESRVLEMRQNSPNANKENVKPIEASASIARSVGKGPPSMALDQRKQIDNLKKFSVEFRLQSCSNPDAVFEPMMAKTPRDLVEKPKDQAAEKSTVDSTGPKVPMESSISEETSTSVSGGPTGNKSGTPSLSPSSAVPEQKRGPDVMSQGFQTSSSLANAAAKDQEEKEEKNDPVAESVRKSTLNPNAKEFNPRIFCSPPKPATTPTQTRPQGQPSPSIVVQQPPAVYGQTMFQMYPLTPVSPGVQKSIIWKPPAMYHVQVPHMTMSQTKPYRPVPNMPQQRPDQHHPPGTSTMMHPATAAGPPIVAPSPAYSTQYFTCSPQQFASQPLVQQMPHYQSQAQHVFSPMIQSGARMITPPGHAQPSLVSSSTTQYGEQTHTMYVSPTPIPQQFPHPGSTFHPHPQHPQPSATPTGQPQQGTQHGGSHPAPSPVQHSQHQAAAQAIHLGNPPQQQMYSALAPTPPSMTPGPNPQSPQGSYPSAQQAVYIHPQQMQHGYNPNHMAHVQQAHMQSGMVPPHHGTPSHPPTMMLMATQAPAGPQPGALNPIPVSSATHYSYTLTPVQGHHPQQL
ncbi:ataxin-2-like isoform X2 [Carassius auratus]|uniref:Ataxin-2-like isoform X2 n=1 Tax=Carassius auratus TaxID=7957 RepID=A0A6P6K461_CARAU|nr:ataxin-2-like isoform X2 [Carassius auratus]